jgi:hypothetical protein
MRIKLKEGQKLVAENGDTYIIEAGDTLQENNILLKQLEKELLTQGLNGKSISIIRNAVIASLNEEDLEEKLYMLMRKKMIPTLNDELIDVIIYNYFSRI